jgi:hypothetical protein
LQASKIPPAEELRLYTFDFDDMAMDDEGTLKACVRMFMEADIINQFKVPYEVSTLKPVNSKPQNSTRRVNSNMSFACPYDIPL